MSPLKQFVSPSSVGLIHDRYSSSSPGIIPLNSFMSFPNHKIELKAWIKNIEVNVIYADEKRGLKTIKCISKELMSSIPIRENIALYKSKEIIKRYYKNSIIDCPIV